MNKFARWSYLYKAAVVMLFLGMMYSWTTFRIPLAIMFKSWTISQTSLTFTIAIIMYCIGNITGGKLFAFLSSRTIYLLSAFCLFTGYFGVALGLDPAEPSGSLFYLYCFYGALCGFGVGVGYNGTLSTLLGWFPDKTGLATGIMMMSIGSGALILSGLINTCIDVFGVIITFRIAAVTMALVLGAASFIIKRPDKKTTDSLKLTVKNSSSIKASTDRSLGDYPPLRMLGTSIFWLFFMRLIFIASGGLIIINSASQIAAMFGVNATLGLLVSLFNGCGGILFGSFFDRYGRAASFTLNSGMVTLAGIFMLLASVTGQAFLIFIGIPLVGLSYGGSAAITSTTVRLLWGSKYYPTNFGIVSCSLIPASILGPLISSTLQEIFGGSYTSAFVMLILFGVLSLVLNLLLRIAIRNSPPAQYL